MLNVRREETLGQGLGKKLRWGEAGEGRGLDRQASMCRCCSFKMHDSCH